MQDVSCTQGLTTPLVLHAVRECIDAGKEETAAYLPTVPILPDLTGVVTGQNERWSF